MQIKIKIEKLDGQFGTRVSLQTGNKVWETAFAKEIDFEILEFLNKAIEELLKKI